MSIRIFTALFVPLILVSCGNKQTATTWKTYTSQDKSYTVEIPSDFSLHSNEVGGWMSFLRTSQNSSDAAFITIKPVTNGFASFDDDLSQNPKFQYSVYKESSNLKFAECSKGMWNAVKLGMLKEFDNTKYLIVLDAQNSRSNSENIIRHIFDSMVKGVPDFSQVEEELKETELKKYSNPYLTIFYPKDWIKVNNPDSMTDVYIGAKDDTLGFTIVRFDTDASLSEITRGAKYGADSNGIRTTYNKNHVVNGEGCNRMVNEFDYEGIPIKTIAYTFKKGNTLYSIKFGTQKQYVDANIDLIEKIINSFEIK